MKQLIKKILKEETELPISVKRRIDVDKINKLINQYKLTSFNTDWSVDECVMATVAKVSGNLIPVFEYDDDEHDKLYNSLRKFLYDRYVEELKLYFEKRKEDYKNRKPSNVFYIFKKHKELYIQDFDNCMSVLFYWLKTNRTGEQKIKNSLEYKIAKVITKPYRIIQKLLAKKQIS